MSERFDDLLSAVVTSAAGAAREPGAEAARKRGRQRRNRQRLAASTLSLALLGAVGGVAAITMHDPTGVPTAHATSTTPATSTPASPSTMASASPSPSGPLPTGSSGSPSASTPTGSASSTGTASPHTYVAGAWLSPEQMPLYQAGSTTWAYDSYNYGTHLGGHVYLSPTTHITDWCSDVLTISGNLSSLENGLTGSQYQAFTGPDTNKILPNGTIPAYSLQAAYFYPDAAAATAAFNGLAGDFATCATKATGVDPSTGTNLTGTTQQTLSQNDARCWSLLAAGKGTKSANAGTLDHDCFVHSGTVIEEVHLEDNEDGSFTTQSFTAADAGLVPLLQRDLRAYPGS